MRRGRTDELKLVSEGCKYTAACPNKFLSESSRFGGTKCGKRTRFTITFEALKLDLQAKQTSARSNVSVTTPVSLGDTSIRGQVSGLITTYFSKFKVPFVLWEYFLGVSHRGSSLLTQWQTFGLN